MEFTYNVEDMDNCKVVRLYGNLSLSSCVSLEKFLREAMKKSSVIIDLQESHLITTSGMTLLVNAGIEARSNGKRVVIMRPGSDFKEMMERMHSYEYFILVDSVEEGRMKIKYYT